MWAFCGGVLSLCKANIYGIFYVPTLKRGLPELDCHKWNHKVHAFFLHNPRRINLIFPKNVSMCIVQRVCNGNEGFFGYNLCLRKMLLTQFNIYINLHRPMNAEYLLNNVYQLSNKFLGTLLPGPNFSNPLTQYENNIVQCTY